MSITNSYLTLNQMKANRTKYLPISTFITYISYYLILILLLNMLKPIFSNNNLSSILSSNYHQNNASYG